MKELEELLNKANVISYFGGNPGSLMRRIDGIVKDLEKDDRMREYWEKFGGGVSIQSFRKEKVRNSFCLLTQRGVFGIIASLNEMSDLFFGESIPREIRTQRFLNSKTDVLKMLASGIASRSDA